MAPEGTRGGPKGRLVEGQVISGRGPLREGKRNDIPVNNVGQDFPDDRGRSRTACRLELVMNEAPGPDSAAQLAQLGEGRCLVAAQGPGESCSEKHALTPLPVF